MARSQPEDRSDAANHGIALCVAIHSPQSSLQCEDEVIYPNLLTVRFHDGKHTAVTTLCAKGVPEWVIQGHVGHVAPEMMKTTLTLGGRPQQAAAALEPAYAQHSEEVKETIN